MDNVIKFPNDMDRSWNLIRPEILAGLLDGGLSMDIAEKVTNEMEFYHRLVYRPIRAESPIVSDVELTPEQTNAVQSSITSATESVREQMLQLRSEIQAQFCRLLVEKYTGG